MEHVSNPRALMDRTFGRQVLYVTLGMAILTFIVTFVGVIAG